MWMVIKNLQADLVTDYLGSNDLGGTWGDLPNFVEVFGPFWGVGHRWFVWFKAPQLRPISCRSSPGFRPHLAESLGSAVAPA